MSVKRVVLKQYQSIVDQTAQAVRGVTVPKEGWLRTVRKSMDMSGAQLARKLGVTRANISRTEKAELDGAVTLKTMEQMAEALGCQFVYAVVPHTDVKAIIDAKAEEKARLILKRTNKHMALEDQQLKPEQELGELERVKDELKQSSLSKLWD